MLQFVEMGNTSQPVIRFKDQMETETHPVILVNIFTVQPSEIQEFLKTWTEDASIMKSQPGFISTQLHSGIGESGVFLNYAVWESTAAFRAAFKNPKFQASVQKYPPSTVGSPHLFQKVAIPGVCVS